MKKGIKFNLVWLWLTFPLYVLDRISKWLIVQNFPEFTQTFKIVVIPDFFSIIRVHNKGMAFGLGNQSTWAPVFFLVISIVALVWVIKSRKSDLFSGATGQWAPYLLVAGILGNFTDRLLYGYVVDFLDFTLPFTKGYHWPSFNIADSCICIAAGLLFISSFSSSRKKPSKKISS